MKDPLRWAMRLYSLSLRIYPRAFRSEFADEMLYVFSHAAQDASIEDLFAFTRFCVQEWFGLLFGAAREYTTLITRRGEKEMVANHITSDGDVSQFDTSVWKGAFLAGLPYLLFGMIASAGQIIYAYFPLLVALTITKYVTWVGIIFFIASVGVVLYAWRLRFPIWSASWFGYAAFAIIAGLSLLNERLVLITNDLFNNTLALGSILAVAVGILWLFRKDSRKGILAMLFLMPMTILMFMEFVPPRIEWLVYLGFGILTASCAAGIVLLPDWRKGFWLVLGFNLITGILIAYIESYLIEMPSPHTHTPSLAEAGAYLLLYSFMILLLVVGPVLFWRIWDFTRGRLAA